MSERLLLGVLVLSVVLLGVGKRVGLDYVPVALTVPVLIGGWRLPRRSLLALGGVVGVVLLVHLAANPDLRSSIAAGIVVIVLLLSLRYARLRESWGMGMRTGMALLLTLRDQVRSQGEPPPMDAGWAMGRGLRSAGDAAFRGDFTLATHDGALVQAMVVDVSGHGLDVAPRAVQLAGAFGGLLRVSSPEATLAACNTYVVRQEWDHDYATAVHAILDQRTGRVELRCAGHPPPRVRRADGTWEDVMVRGVALGLMPAATYGATSVTLGPGDTVVLVSDGALDERSDEPWRPVEHAVERWWADGAPSGTTLHPAAPSATDDQTIIAVARRGDR
jgi:hypothetical protein